MVDPESLLYEKSTSQTFCLMTGSSSAVGSSRTMTGIRAMSADRTLMTRISPPLYVLSIRLALPPKPIVSMRSNALDDPACHLKVNTVVGVHWLLAASPADPNKALNIVR